MKIVFVSNFFNHHQKPFSEEMYKLTDENIDIFFYYTLPCFYIEDNRVIERMSV